MLAKFIGEDGSLGLRHGFTYDVTAIRRPSDWKREGSAIWVQIATEPALTICPYSSFDSLFRNWEFVQYERKENDSK